MLILVRFHALLVASFPAHMHPYSDTDCNEHGTHVSGIVGALPNSYGFTGVAPEATLAMYRVFGCTGSAGDDVVRLVLASRDFSDASVSRLWLP